jgi:UDP-glucose 4-epimerase
LRYLTLAEQTLKEELANGIGRKLTPYRLQSDCLGSPASFSPGTDYDTRDGSCVRDFVHVLDLADAHTRAIEHLLNNGTSHALNPGPTWDNGRNCLRLFSMS